MKFRAKTVTSKGISDCRALLLTSCELVLEVIKQAAKMWAMVFRKLVLLHKVVILRGCAKHQVATLHHQRSGNISCNSGPLASCLVKAFIRISLAIHLGLAKASERHIFLQLRAVSHELSPLLQECGKLQTCWYESKCQQRACPRWKGKQGVSAQPWATPAPSASFQVPNSLQPQGCPSPPTKYLPCSRLDRLGDWGLLWPQYYVVVNCNVPPCLGIGACSQWTGGRVDLLIAITWLGLGWRVYKKLSTPPRGS